MTTGLTPGEWIAFAALILTMMGGGVTAAIWVSKGIADLATRLSVVETKLDLLLSPETVPPSRRHRFAGNL
jgi:hypothetical protein